MAYAALVSLAQTVDLILNHDKYSISVDEKENFLSIREYVNFLMCFLEDFPERAYRLEGKIRDMANETEDIIEDFMWKQIQMSRWRVGLSRIEFKHQLEKVTEEIGLIAGEMMDDRLSDSPAAISSSRLAITAKNDVVIGLDDDLIAIKSRLCGESSKLQVIPIVGMGGMGKTTLARTAYDDPLIMDYFHICAWVQVSQDYSAKNILSGLLDSMKLFEEQMLAQKNEFLMAEIVYKSLKGRRYLIVIDDVWSSNAWDDVRNIFPDDDNGSRVMLTTRLFDVATYASSSSPVHVMKFMDENLSWNLLKQKVFAGDNGQDCPPELEDVGKDIARSCGGLPLAVVLVAGILNAIVKTRASWEKIAKNVNSVVDDRLEKILYLSYKHLPHHLRPCLLFIGGFPEDYEICVSKLIKLWVAEGFLKHKNRYKSLEEEAEEYLEDLVKRNLVLVASRKTNGKIKSCSLHDLVRDLCIRIDREEKFLLHVTDGDVFPASIKYERRISIACSLQHKIWGPTIRTIICFQLDSFSCGPLDFLLLGSFRLLRILDVVDCGNVILPSQVFELFHLRYLALGVSVEIPSTISNLENLQTLICPSSPCLPLEIWRMRLLRDLVVFDLCELPDPPNGSTLPLENLQTLSLVASLVCNQKILEMIPNLKKLGFFCDPNRMYQLPNLIHLHQLEKLKVIISRGNLWRGHIPAFPRTLKKLTVDGSLLTWKDMNIVGSLPILEVLKLKCYACSDYSWETIEGEFPQLKCLIIEISNLQYWITESSHFPKLKHLTLRHCPLLREIPEGISEIPTLEVIEVDDLNQSLLYSAKQIQEDQQSYGNDALQIRCVSYHQIRRRIHCRRWKRGHLHACC